MAPTTPVIIFYMCIQINVLYVQPFLAYKFVLN